MASHENRGRIRCAPLSLRKIGILDALPASLEALAYTYTHYPLLAHGTLVRVKTTGRLSEWMGGSLRSVDPRKAQAALNTLKYREDHNYDWSKPDYT